MTHNTGGYIFMKLSPVLIPFSVLNLLHLDWLSHTEATNAVRLLKIIWSSGYTQVMTFGNLSSSSPVVAPFEPRQYGERLFHLY